MRGLTAPHIYKHKHERIHHIVSIHISPFSFIFIPYPVHLYLQLELTIDHLPPINEPLVCAFTTADKPTIYTNATRKRNGVNCTTPRTDLLPQIPQGKRKSTSNMLPFNFPFGFFSSIFSYFFSIKFHK